MLPSRSNTGVSKTRVSGTGPLVGVPKTLVFDTGEDGANDAAFPPLVLRCSSGRAAQGGWLALIPNMHEGYLSWEEFEVIQGAIRENFVGGEQPGAAKHGAALLAGLLRCRRCGRKLTVSYTGNSHALRYTCDRGWLDNAQQPCIAFGGIPVDEAMSKEVLQVAQPAAVEAAVLASQEEARQRDDVLEALRRDLEAAHYAAQRARRQYDATDPENRLVAGELERRWNQALQHVREVEVRIEQHELEAGQQPRAEPQEFEGVGQATRNGVERPPNRRTLEETDCPNTHSRSRRRCGQRGRRSDSGDPLEGGRACPPLLSKNDLPPAGRRLISPGNGPSQKSGHRGQRFPKTRSKLNWLTP